MRPSGGSPEADVADAYTKPLEDIAYPHEPQVVAAALQTLGLAPSAGGAPAPRRPLAPATSSNAGAAESPKRRGAGSPAAEGGR